MYALLDCNGVIVYIGITNSPFRRNKEHETKDKIYTYECKQCKIRMVPLNAMYTFKEEKNKNYRQNCLAEEKRQIKKYAPIFNDKDNPTPMPERKKERGKWRDENCCDDK